MEYRIGAKRYRYTNTLGKINICPRGLEYSAFVVDQPVDCTIVELNRAVLQRLLVGSDDLTKVNLAFRDGFFDPAIWRLVRAIDEEIAAGCPSGDVYGKSLSVALLTYLLARYSADAPQLPSRHRLTDEQLRLVVDCMRAHLEANISLARLASLAQTGIYEFCRRFKNTTGFTPHNYLTQLRVEEGKRLLAEHHASIAEVSLMLGFANQSHFTRVFHKMTGTTPKRFRENSARTVLQMSRLDAVRDPPRHRLGRARRLAARLKRRTIQGLSRGRHARLPRDQHSIRKREHRRQHDEARELQGLEQVRLLAWDEDLRRDDHHNRAGDPDRSAGERQLQADRPLRIEQAATRQSTDATTSAATMPR